MRSLRWVGLVFSLLIVGVLGGLMAALPAEAMSLEIAGQQNVSVTTFTCSTSANTSDRAYTLCAYITTAPLVRRTIGTWYVDDISSTNRARVRIKDLAGAAGSANIDMMNITGMKIRPSGNSGTTHVKIVHTYSSGQTAGAYWWGMGVTGNFDPIGGDHCNGDLFRLTGTGTFNSATDIRALGILDVGTITDQEDGFTCPITQSIAAHQIGGTCNTGGSGFCRPTITYDLLIQIVADTVIPIETPDSLVLTDSGIACAVIVPEGEDCVQKPLGSFCKALKKCDATLVGESRGVKPVTTCINTNTCGTIVINKTIAEFYDFGGACGHGGLCPNTPILQDIQTYGFDGTGFGIYPFDITTDGVTTGSTGSYSLKFLDTTADTRIIRETVFPTAAFPGTCNPSNPCFNDVFWFTKTVSCTPASGGPEGFVYSTHNGLKDLGQNLDGTLKRSGYVEVTSLAVNPAGGPVNQLTCTFVNGIFEEGG